ncbi:hypothetical protein [Streptomyces griseocarneus]|uniref:Uncharacterized protein n=1 Tax=Streptomyces griseocarneus TaxID=51201 RepID=A0ABX7RS49_9ACTN|nr:hypothetical protein [Streptomyces griseocarneus]QSY51095.1 hypothetical protein J3S04_09440 [Streptomyces griseocarneus]
MPARVVRWYQPSAVGSGPVAEAERLLRLWHVQADPTLLHEARERAAPAAAIPLAPSLPRAPPAPPPPRGYGPGSSSAGSCAPWPAPSPYAMTPSSGTRC